MTTTRPPLQDGLFDYGVAPSTTDGESGPEALKVLPAPASPEDVALAGALPPNLRLGTSSWNYPGWTGKVWAQDYAEARLSRHGLPAYARHPLFRAVSLDRGFYRPLTATLYAAYAAQVPAGFRFVVKAPSLVTDAMIRGDAGRGLKINRNFLDPELATREFAQPAAEGLGPKLGALVFQLSPLPEDWLARWPQLLDRLSAMLGALPSAGVDCPRTVTAVEVRDPDFLLSRPLREAFISVLRAHGATYCMGLHAKMPPIAEHLPLLRALWPGPLVCRWNLNRLHGGYGYEKAKRLYLPFDRIHDPDPDTRNSLARVVQATTAAGYDAYVTVSNKAEGCAPLTIRALAEAVRAMRS